MEVKYDVQRKSYLTIPVTSTFCFIVGLTLCSTLLFLFFLFSGATEEDNGKNALANFEVGLSCRSGPLFFIPQEKVDVWNEREFLIVFGIPSLDIPNRRWRRRMQRITCWQFPEVATRENNFTGAFLPLYLLARHPSNDFVLSEDAVREAKAWQDILLHPTNEGGITTNKLAKGYGKWGLDAEIGSSRKTFFWFRFALRQFPQVPYVGKGDDDMFLRVPLYLVDLRLLPLRRVYWGRYAYDIDVINRRKTVDVEYVHGYCLTMSSDVVEQLLSYKPAEKLLWTPYSKSREMDFILLSMKHEDVMVGHVLNRLGYPMVFFEEEFPRFSLLFEKEHIDEIVAVHVPKEEEYYMLMSHYLLNLTTYPRSLLIKKTHRYFLIKSLTKKGLL